MKDGGQVEFEPFSPGISDRDDIEALADEVRQLKGNIVYTELISHVGEMVTIRFPEKDGWKFGTVEAILEKCTPNFITVREPAIVIALPGWMASLQERLPGISEGTMLPKSRTIPEYAASVPLAFISVAEDVKNKRPLIVFDHSFWDREKH